MSGYSGDWWCVTDYHDEGAGSQFVLIHTGIVAKDGSIHTDKRELIFETREPYRIWDRFNEIQKGALPEILNLETPIESLELESL